MSTNHPIGADRVRKLIELLGSAGEVSFEHRTAHLVEGMCHLVGASAAVLVRADQYFPGGDRSVVGVESSGFSGGGRKAYLDSVLASRCGDPVLTPLGLYREPGAYRRRDMLSDREWYGTPWVCEELRAAELDDGIYAAHPIEGSSLTACLGVFRVPGDRPFTEEDREIFDVLNLESRRLLRPPAPSAITKAARGLTPRQAQTLERLCLGESEKEIAYALAISHNTVHQYVKTLYRLFCVRSRGELLARFIDERAT